MYPELSDSPDTQMCPYPAVLTEISTEQIIKGIRLTLNNVIECLDFILWQEFRCTMAKPLWRSELATSCLVILNLLTRVQEITRDRQLRPLEELHLETVVSRRNFRIESNPSDELLNATDIAFWHGGIVGLNKAHLEYLFRLSLNAKMRNAHVLIGFETDKYLATKLSGGRRFLRPWPLIVTVSIFEYLADIYGLPISTFIMPPIPDSRAVWRSHYAELYQQIRSKHPRTLLVISDADPYKDEKLALMQEAGFSKKDYSWVTLSSLLVPSTTRILADLDGYRGLSAELTSYFDIDQITSFYLARIKEWIQCLSTVGSYIH